MASSRHLEYKNYNKDIANGENPNIPRSTWYRWKQNGYNPTDNRYNLNYNRNA